MRNPASVCRVWPDLVVAMKPLRDALLRWHSGHPSLHGLAGACGAHHSARAPPSTDEIQEMRKEVGSVLGLNSTDLEAHHAAAPWRHDIVKDVESRAGDPDTPLSEWLEHGAPMGLSQPIAEGGLFPTQVPSPELDLDELAALDAIKANHPSFLELHGEDVSPGLKLLEKQLNASFGHLFSPRAAAEVCLGARTRPAPLGNIAKPRPYGTTKHRLIQDCGETV